MSHMMDFNIYISMYAVIAAVVFAFIFLILGVAVLAKRLFRTKFPGRDETT